MKKEYRLATRELDGSLYVGHVDYETKNELVRRVREARADGVTSWFGVEREVGDWKAVEE